MTLSPSYILSIDQGTTSTKAILMDQQMNIIARQSKGFDQHYPQPGWVEHAPEQIWNSVKIAVTKAIEQANIKPAQIAGIGITNQRETTVAWDRSTGHALHNAIVWQCRRTSDYCQNLHDQGHESKIINTTGLLIDPYFSASKMNWLLHHVPAVTQQAQQKNLCLGTIDAFLTFRLTQGQSFVTDISNASRTQLMNLQTGHWDSDMLCLFDVPVELLPSIKPNAKVIGHTRALDFLPDGIPIAGLIGDQQSALYGQQCLQPGQAKCTYGTGAFMLVQHGPTIPRSSHRLLSTAAWQINDTIDYALEGSVFMAGATIEWLQKGLGLDADINVLMQQAQSVPDTGGVVFVPAFTGLGAPYWDPEAKACITGMTRGTTAAHIIRAAFEGIAFQVYDLAHAMAMDGAQPQVMNVDGGVTQNTELMQFQADLLQKPLHVSSAQDITALGAGMMAAKGIGWKLPSDFSMHQQIITPQQNSDWKDNQINKWRQAVSKVRIDL